MMNKKGLRCQILQLFALTILMLIGLTYAQNSMTVSVCPPQEMISPCRCAQKSGEFQVWCSHSDLPRVLNGIRSVSKYIDKPIDELILENNQLPSLPSRFFSTLQIIRLMLRNNGVERLASGWLNGLEPSLVEIFIVERNLRSLPFDSLIDCKNLQAVTIQSEHLKRTPSFGELMNLRYIKVQSYSLLDLPPYGFIDLPMLENIYITSSPNLNRLEAGLFQNLNSLKTLNCFDNGISWIHLRAFNNLPLLNTLDLSRNEITDAAMVGRAIKDLTKLQTLHLDHNFITTLSEGSFVDLESIKELYLNDNAIQEIHHGAFHKTPQLKLLHLENNFLRRIHPESFLQTSGRGVEYLHIQHNEISNIDEVKSLLDALPMLKFLDLSYNKLESVPFGSLRGHGALEQLCLDHNNIVRIERDAFMAMPGLRELRLKNNSLTENTPLPFWNLPGLKGLDLSDNKFITINDTLLSGLPSLRRLDLSNNELIAIESNAFVNNLYLETINISKNSIREIHPSTFRYLNRLFEIDASYNQLEELLPGLPRIVERVNVESNKISSLPSGSSKMFDLPNLRMLNLGTNQLHKISVNAFKTLHQLRSLSLANNHLASIYENNFNGLNRLELLNLENNDIATLEERCFSPLTDLMELNLQRNNLERIVDIISTNTHLEHFDASQNNIIEISSNTFLNCRMLQSLDLSRNALKELPSSSSTLNELREIDISYNQLTDLPSNIITSWRKIEELRASNNKVTELPQNTFVDLPSLQYLDLSSNELKVIGTGSLKQLPQLQELVLADNQLVELGERSFEDLPNLQALHLQHNYLRYISPMSFYRTGSIVYMNLSMNHFDNMEHMGLRSTRNLEVLDVSGNQIRRVATNPLRNLDWLVELNLDNNAICKVQGEPFASMPRLKVLTMRNNRMKSVTESTFRHLRGNLALFDLEGNPLHCSCDMLWLRAWYQETNTYPGPRCRDGNFLTELRYSKSDCDNVQSTDSRLNQVLLTNEHGDVFKRQIAHDDCDTEQLDNNFNEKIPVSPIESEYFYEQYIDYPFNDSSVVDDGRLSLNRNDSNIRNQTLLNYNQYKLHQMQQKNPSNSSPFTFFGMPLPSLSNLWGSGARSNNGRKTGSRAEVDGNGKSRLRHYRPRPGEIVESFQFSNGGRQSGLPVPPHPPYRINPNHITNMSPPPPPGQNSPPYYSTTYFGPQIEKGGFVPMLPGDKGFTPIENPYANETNTEDEEINNDNDDIQETVSTELKPNINSDIDDLNDENYSDEDESRYHVRVPTLLTEPNSTKTQQTIDQRHYNVSSLKKGENTVPTTSSSGIPLIHNTNSFDATIPIPIQTTEKPIEQKPQTIQKIIENSIINRNLSIIDNITITSSIHTKKNNTFKGTALTALAAPGSQQGVFRPIPGRSVITKIFSTTLPPAVTSSIPTTIPPRGYEARLPTAEEYLRTTALGTNGKQISTTATPRKISNKQNNSADNSNVSSAANKKESDMEWYYRNYNRTTWKEPQSDPGLNRFFSNNSANSINFCWQILSIYFFMLSQRILF